MVATHVIAARTADGDLSLGQWVAGGRASALFALLAGVGLALATGGRRPVRGTERAARSAGIVVRALLIASLGLVLGGLDSGLAVILTNYGLLFLLSIAFLGWSPRLLLPVAAVWVVAAPVISALVRPALPERGFDSPNLDQLADPVRLLSELAWTGYYPVVPWMAYLLVGLAVGRLDLSGVRVPAALSGVGAALCVGATVLSDRLVALPGVVRTLRTEPPQAEATGRELLDRIDGGMFGVTPTDGAWEWLLVVAPHSATPFDLAQTIGSSLLVLGLCLLLTNPLPELARGLVAVLAGAGAMTLSLYTLHVLLRVPGVLPPERAASYQFNVLVLLVIGAMVAVIGWRGPLEALIRQASLGAAAAVRAGIGRPAPVGTTGGPPDRPTDSSTDGPPDVPPDGATR